MKTLERIFEGIEAFRRDMVELGVPVHVDYVDTPAELGPRVAINLRALVRMELEEDLEAVDHGE